MPGLFDQQEAAHLDAAKPLAARMRPRSLDEFVGQQHFLGAGKLLNRMLEADRLGSLIFFGPPGTGKTTLAEIIANQSAAKFVPLNAASLRRQGIAQCPRGGSRPTADRRSADRAVRRRIAPFQQDTAGRAAA